MRSTSTLRVGGSMVVAALLTVGARSAGSGGPPWAQASAAASGSVPAEALAPPPPLPPAPAFPWQPRSTDRLDVRFTPPREFARVAVAEGSFAGFLRALPLLPRGTAVVDYGGGVVRSPDDPGIAAVVDIDVGQTDLQQCADAIVRMNAEWHYSRGDRGISYRVSSGTLLSYEQYLAGRRAVARGNELLVEPMAARVPDDHRAFRAYLDEVFTWANTSSLERDGAPVAFADVRAGDFFVMSGKPFGHAVLVLDVARSERGAIAMLLGQSYMPAQSFQVLKSFPHGEWFVVEPGATDVVTPFWKPFPLASLRRLP